MAEDARLPFALGPGEPGPTPDPETGRIHELIADIDSLCTDGRWADVVAARDACRLAVQRGHQWWPAAAWAEYRLALDGPPSLAAGVLGSSLDRYTLGPFAEVAASTHSWDELAPFLDGSPAAALFAYECVALGDDLRADDVFRRLPGVFDVPGALESWEPGYGPVVYHLDRVEHDAPIPTGIAPRPHSAGPSPIAPAVSVEDQPTCDSLRAVLDPWRADPSWTVTVSAWEGTIEAAVKAMTTMSDPDGSAVMPMEVAPLDALRFLAWLGASGGPAGRRRGLASGRSSLWWALVHLTGLDEDEESQSLRDASRSVLDAFAAEISALRWFTWADPGHRADDAREVVGTVRGWSVRIGVEHPADGLCWTMTAQLVGDVRR